METPFSTIRDEVEQIRQEENGPSVLNVPKAFILSAKRRLDRIENRFYLTKLAYYASRLAFGKIRFYPAHMKAVLLGKLSSKRVVPQILLNVCSLCQNRCPECANEGAIDLNRQYEMSLDSLKRFIQYTSVSGYYIESVWFEGPGEPTLWRHFNEAFELLHESGTVGSINFTTNAQSLDRIAESTWPHIGRIIVSQYPSHHHVDLTELRRKSRRYGFILEVRPINQFRTNPTAAHPDTLPASCGCSGPMIYDDKVFFYCGTPAIAAGILRGRSILDDPQYTAPLGPNYLSGICTKDVYSIYSYRTGRLALCNYCWANMKIKTPTIPHELHP